MQPYYSHNDPASGPSAFHQQHYQHQQMQSSNHHYQQQTLPSHHQHGYPGHHQEFQHQPYGAYSSPLPSPGVPMLGHPQQQQYLHPSSLQPQQQQYAGGLPGYPNQQNHSLENGKNVLQHTRPNLSRKDSGEHSDSSPDVDEDGAVAGSTSSAKTSSTAQKGSKGVVRAACLSCRTAKRRCDGVQPVCGPCIARGVSASTGACQFVASKRGGPRYRGFTGEEAKKLKAEKERQKLEQAQASEAAEATTGLSGRSNGSSQRGLQVPSSAQARDGSNFSQHQVPLTSPGFAPDTMQMDPGSASSAGGRSSFPTNTSGGPSPISASQYLTSPEQSIAPLQRHFDGAQGWQGASNGLVPSPQVSHATGNQHDLSSANLDLWQRIQDTAAAEGGVPTEFMLAGNDAPFSLNDFYAKLESLPKAGLVGSSAAMLQDPNWTDPGNASVLDAADSEQQARFLLTAFFDKVYASVPVLPAPENLSSLAFWFSGKGPCALYAAISALVTLRLDEPDAYRTLRGGVSGTTAPDVHPGMSRAEVAAHHAKTSDLLLRRFSQQQAAKAAAAFGLDPKILSNGCDPDEDGRALCQGSKDIELLHIEAAAAHTLLCHYHYGLGGAEGQRLAHFHSLEAWNLLQGIRIQLSEQVAPSDPLVPGQFSSEQKQEWAKRVYWTSYAAAAVTAATGGFQPLKSTCDAVTALKLRPASEADVGSWGVFIRGAQHVARAYTVLFELEELKDRHSKGAPEAEVSSDRAKIFNEFCKLERDMTSFSTYDPAWRSMPEADSSQGFSHEQRLGSALRTAGKLMTAGSTIIIHRGQAFANARIFMEPQCGIPQARRRDAQEGCDFNRLMYRAESAQPAAGEDSVMSNGEEEFTPGRMWHRSGSISLPPAGTSSEEQQERQRKDSDGMINGTGTFTVPRQPHEAMSQANTTNATMMGLQNFHIQQSSPRLDQTASPLLQQQQQQQQSQQQSQRQSQQPLRSPLTASSAAAAAASGQDSDRYQYGPFEPEYSAQKCKWAAASMMESVNMMVSDPLKTSINVAEFPSDPRSQRRALLCSGNEAPTLPPWSACSFVLASYCLLMQCLALQAGRSSGSPPRRKGPNEEVSASRAKQSANEVDEELRNLQCQVLAIHDLLHRFSLTHNIALGYKQEVAILLEVNRRLNN